MQHDKFIKPCSNIVTLQELKESMNNHLKQCEQIFKSSMHTSGSKMANHDEIREQLDMTAGTLEDERQPVELMPDQMV